MIYAIVALSVVVIWLLFLLSMSQQSLGRKEESWTVERTRLLNLFVARTPAEFASLQRSASQPAAVDPHEREHPFVRKAVVKSSDIPTPWDESDQMPAVLPIGL